MIMTGASQMIAGQRVEHAKTEEGGTYRDVGDIKHGNKLLRNETDRMPDGPTAWAREFSCLIRSMPRPNRGQDI